MHYPQAPGYIFAGLAIGSLISAVLGYEAFGIEALFPVLICAVATYYFGKSKSIDS